MQVTKRKQFAVCPGKGNGNVSFRSVRIAASDRRETWLLKHISLPKLGTGIVLLSLQRLKERPTIPLTLRLRLDKFWHKDL